MTDFTPVELLVGYISPLREYVRPRDEPKRKRNPIGFVHFGEPEEEPRSYLDEYLMAIEDRLEELDDDELRVGFTAADII
jgi:hypothetical protein